MKPSPNQPEDTRTQQEKSLAAMARRRRQALLSLRVPSVAANPTLGDILLPFLFAAMETCWLDAILIGLAAFGLFQSNQPLIPLWAPFVLLIGSQWILSRLERRAMLTSTSPTSEDSQPETGSTLPGSSLFILFITLTTLFIVWITIYTPNGFFLDPRWLFALLNDILLLDVQAYHVFSIVAITLYLCWRSVRLLHREYEPSQVFGTLRLGMGIIVAVILLRAGQSSTGGVINDDFVLLILVPLFLFLSLAAHALARISFLRHTHPLGLEGDISTNERSIFLTIAMIGLVLLLISWLADIFASPTILTFTEQLFTVLGQVYDWLISVLAVVIVFLATPLFLLVTWWVTLFPPHLPPPSPAQHHRIPGKPLPPPSAAALTAFLPLLKVLFPILLAIIAILLVRWLVRRRKRVTVVTNRRIEELHESLWSWSLFWIQLKALLYALFRRFFPSKTVAPVQTQTETAIVAEPAVRTIREMYRALLKRAAARGYPRKKDETPYEFEQRLVGNIPLAQPQLATLTEAYTSTRYGGHIPDESELTQVRHDWTMLEQKWSEGTG